MKEASREQPNLERVRSTLREVSAQVSDATRAALTLSADERAEMYAIGREITQLGLETQLWAYGVRTHEAVKVSEMRRVPRSARTTGEAAGRQN